MHGSLLERLKETAQLEFSERKLQEKELAPRFESRLSLLEEALKDPDVRVRRSAVEVLRRLSSKSPAPARMLAGHLPGEPDVKTRRRIASALGSSGRREALPSLLEQLQREEHRFVQASLILALGNLGFSDWPPPYDDWQRTSGPVAEALSKAKRNALAGGPREEVHLARPAGTYALRCFPGTAEIVQLEAKRIGLSAAATGEPGILEVAAESSDELERIGHLNTIHEELHLVARHADPSSPGDLAPLLESGAREIILTLPPGWHEPARFRLSLPAERTKNLYVKQVKNLSRLLETKTGWINVPSDYELNLQVIRWKGGFALGWRHRCWETPRDQPGREVLPASIHPAMASVLCHVAVEDPADLGRARDDSCLAVDLCCGAGTLLHEWLRLFPASRVLGTDKSGRAIRLAQANLRDHAAQSELRSIPFQKLRTNERSADFILVNPPFGQRVKSASSIQDLYRDLLLTAARLLKPTGVLVLYTGNRKAIEAVFRHRQLPAPTPRLLAETGGRVVGIFRFRQPILKAFAS